MAASLTLDRPAPGAAPGTTRNEDRRWLGVFALWLVLALAASALGVVSMDRLALVPAGLLAGVLALVLAYRRVPSFRAFARGIDLRIPILFHFVRLPIGIAFLVLESFQRLDPTFATRAGWGDVLAGGLALVAALATALVYGIGGVLSWLINTAASALVGLVVGSVIATVVARLPFGRSEAH